MVGLIQKKTSDGTARAREHSMLSRFAARMFNFARLILRQ
jgi:hypothetical protein